MIAANIDTAFLVVALDGDFNPRRLERYLAQCWESEVKPVIVLNKTDECSDAAAFVADAERVAASAPVLSAERANRPGNGRARSLSHTRPDDRAARFVWRGKVDTGQSFCCGRMCRRCRRRAKRDGKGRHTTTSRQLLRLPGGALMIDTPGLREIAYGMRKLASRRRLPTSRSLRRIAASGIAGTRGAGLRGARGAGGGQPRRRTSRKPEEAGTRTRISAAQNRSRSEQNTKAKSRGCFEACASKVSAARHGRRQAMTALILDLALARRIELAEAQAAVDCAEALERVRPGGVRRGRTDCRRLRDLLRREFAGDAGRGIGARQARSARKSSIGWRSFIAAGRSPSAWKLARWRMRL